MSYPPQLPNPTRHITVTSPQTGISSLWSEEIPVAPIFPGSQTYRGRVWIADSTPADVMTGADGAKLELKRVVHPSELVSESDGLEKLVLIGICLGIERRWNCYECD